MRPRVHNVLSYSGALFAFATVLAWRARGSGLSSIAGLAGALWGLHFVRRTWESAFVHRYSKPRIGPADYLVEYAYYWGFGAWIAWSISAPAQHSRRASLQVVGLFVFVLAEIGNAHAHRTLRDLRTAGGRERRIPRGFCFRRLSCPHYLFEILSWIGFSLVTQVWAALAFTLVGAAILASWAHTRHVAYRKEFDGRDGRAQYPEQRRALIPFVF